MSRYPIKYKGKVQYYLNSNLIKEQKLNDSDIKRLTMVHEYKLIVYELIKLEDDIKKLKEYSKELTKIEIELQRIWKFPLNKNLHKFWNSPKCKCPKMDNDDRYPFGYYIYNLECPLHGTDLK